MPFHSKRVIFIKFKYLHENCAAEARVFKAEIKSKRQKFDAKCIKFCNLQTGPNRPRFCRSIGDDFDFLSGCQRR